MASRGHNPKAFKSRGSFKRSGGGGPGPSTAKSRGDYGLGGRNDKPAFSREDDGTLAAERLEEVRVQDEVDAKLGFVRFESNRADGEKRDGWLVNMSQVSEGSALLQLALASRPRDFTEVY